MVQKQDAHYFVRFSNGTNHLTTELLASLDHFIYKQTPCEVNKIPSPRMSPFTLNTGKLTIRDLED